MWIRNTISERLPLILGVMLWMAICQAMAQEESAAELRYREDYERYQKIMAVAEPARRADQLFAFLKERPDSKLLEYAQGNYLQILEGYLRSENFKTLLTLSERYVKLRPKVGETYYFYGAALKDASRYPEAMLALAKCYLLRNTASARAKTFMEFIYKSQNQGSLVGMNRIVKQAQDELNK